MPFFSNPYDPDDPKNQPGGAGNVASSAPASVPVTPASSAPALASTAPTASNPGRYVSFAQRFSANGDAARNTAAKLTGDVTDRGQKADSAIKGAWDNFKNQATAGVPQLPSSSPTPATFNRPTGATNQAAPGATQPFNPTPSPAAPTDTTPRYVTPGPGRGFSAVQGNNLENASDEQLKALANGTYGGPKSLADTKGYSDIVSQAQDASTRAGLAGTTAGRQALLSDLTGSMGGGNRLDEALVSGTGIAPFQALRDRFSGLSDKLSNYGKSSENLASNLKGLTADQAQRAQGVLDNRADIASATKTRDATNGAIDASQPAPSAPPTPVNNPDADVLIKLLHLDPNSALANQLRTTPKPVDQDKIHENGLESFETYASLGSVAGDSPLTNWDDAKKVFATVSPSEYAAWQGMTPREKRNWIAGRARRLGLPVTDAYQALPGV